MAKQDRAALQKQIDALEAQLKQATIERQAAIGALAEQNGALDLDDELLAGAFRLAAVAVQSGDRSMMERMLQAPFPGGPGQAPRSRRRSGGARSVRAENGPATVGGAAPASGTEGAGDDKQQPQS